MTVRQDAADTDGGSVKDAIGILTLGTEFALIAFLIYLFRPSEFPGRILLSLFLILALVALMYWHLKDSSESVAAWRKPIRDSIILGVLFYAIDFVLGLVFRQPNSPPILGGPFGIVFTVLVCPGSTIVCVAGLVRAVYVNKTRA